MQTKAEKTKTKRASKTRTGYNNVIIMSVQMVGSGDDNNQDGVTVIQDDSSRCGPRRQL